MADYDDIFETSIQIVPDAIPGGFSKNPREQTIKKYFSGKYLQRAFQCCKNHQKPILESGERDQ